MNKNAIQRYAVWARTEMIAQVSQRAYQYEITPEGYGDINAVSISGRLLSDSEQKQRQDVIRQIQTKGYTQAMEEVAYTWFNRFIALRFMEVNNYLPTHIRVFTDSSGAFKPEILTQALHLDLPNLDMDKVAHLIEQNQTEDLYRYLLLTQCNALNSALPRMFESLGGYTELLLPNNILHQDGVIGRMVSDIPEEDWTDQVQIIGWLYQYYNAELKDETFALLKKNVKVTKERMPSATQMFTPDWVVRHMVENSLGRLWIEGHPDDELKAGWKYYLDEAEQEPTVQEQLGSIREEYRTLRPQDIKVIDPCMGSGHILVYAFDVLVQIYQHAGYSERDAAQDILKSNLYGLDIDDRAAQLAYFAVMMKARQYDRRIFTRNIQPHLYSTASFLEGREFGSLLSSDETESPLGEANQLSLYDEEYQARHILSCKYHVVVTNPPYMGAGNMNNTLTEFVKNTFPDSKSDLSTAFMERSLSLCNNIGYISMINIPVWMFLSSYEKLREKIIRNNTVVSMVHPGRGIFGSDFGTTVFVIGKAHIKEYKGHYRRLFEKQGEVESVEVREQQFLDGRGKFFAKQSNYSMIPGSPIAYWASEQTVKHYLNDPLLGSIAAPCAGLATGDNTRFQRFWFEVVFFNIGFDVNDVSETLTREERWYPCNSGGEFRKWSTDDLIVVDWQSNGKRIKGFRNSSGKLAARPQNTNKYFKEGITWNKLSSSRFAVKYKRAGYIFDDTSRSAFLPKSESVFYYIGLLCSNVVFSFLTLLNPTMSFTNGDLMRIPCAQPNSSEFRTINALVRENINLSTTDWDSFEISWNFQRHPLLQGFSTIRESFNAWTVTSEKRFQTLKSNEEELNRIFIKIYRLEDELTPEIDNKDVTVRLANFGRDIRSLISYSVGCMFGRYSLDIPGLAYAGGDWDSNKYCSFIPAADNVIPICDDEYFEDDITGLFVQWVEVAFGAETLEENLKFIADALGGKGTPRDVIRNYFLNDFYADHLKVYQKRPIYWLFDSGKKNGFKALIYIHRYRSDLLACMRTDYVHEQQERYRTQLRHIGDAMSSSSAAERVRLTKQQKKLQEQSLELQKYEEKIHHLADQNIKIDLDDGVAHNYEIFSEVLAKRK